MPKKERKTARAEGLRIQAEIRDVLMDVWDPIGIADRGAPRDEYDAYIGRVYRLLAGGAGDEEIAAELLRIEKEQIGLTHPGSTIGPTVAALRELKLRRPRM